MPRSSYVCPLEPDKITKTKWGPVDELMGHPVVTFYFLWLGCHCDSYLVILGIFLDEFTITVKSDSDSVSVNMYWGWNECFL